MKIAVFVTMLSLTALPSAFSQYAWFKEFSGNGHVVGTNLSISNDDAIYTIGNFSNSVLVFNNSFSGNGSFIVKVTKQGGLIWVRQIIHSGSNDELTKIRSDDAGNIYIIGTCYQNVTMDGQLISGIQNTSYVAKLNGDGHLEWFKRIPVQNIFDIDVNKQGDVVLIGRLFGSITLEGNFLSCSECSFGVVLTTTGTVLWAKTLGDQSFPISATIDDDGNAYFNGNFWVDFSLDGKSAIANGPYTLFYLKMDALGICHWLTSVKQIEPPNSTAPGSRLVQFGAMKSDGNGNLFSSGHYFKSAEFGNNLLSGNPTNENATSFYFSKFDSNGNVEWAVPRVNNSTGNSIDNVLLNNSSVFATGQDGLQVFIYEYSVAGDFIRETVIPLRGDVKGGFGIDSEDSLYVSGRINDYTANKTTAFVLKLGVATMPSAAHTVNVVDVDCASEGIQLTTDPIQHADTYQWEILYKNQTVVIETSVPELLFIPAAHGIDGECQIRVRGKNDNGTGAFSPYQTIHIDFVLSELQLEKRCDKIVASGSDRFTWFVNGAPASYPDGQIEISPLEEGEYYIQQANECGQKKSNVVNYSKGDRLMIPNIITPNGDVLNEFFVLQGFDENTSVYIFNRWGREVFNSAVYSNDWNGAGLSSGVYFYLIKNPCLKELKGPLTISK